MRPVIRPAASTTEVEAAGALTAEAYRADRLVSAEDDYLDELLDAQRRADEGVLLVALVPSREGGPADVVVGTITLAPHGTSYAEISEPGELELRMLAVAPEARGHGIAERLMRATLREAARLGARRVVLSTMDAMVAAQQLYAKLGFDRALERDWGHEEVHLRVFTWDVPPAPGALVEVATWPPLAAQDVAGFRLGMSAGITRRANCAVDLDAAADDGFVRRGPSEGEGGRSAAQLDRRLAAVEAAYQLAGLAPCWRIDGVGGTLDEALEQRGYAVVTPTFVLVRAIPGPGTGDAPGAASGAELEVTDEPDEAWLDTWLGAGGRSGDRDRARALVTGVPARYLALRVDGQVVGTARVATSAGWAALSSLVVVDGARGRGWGRRLGESALRLAAESGAERAFVQVAEGNDVAIELYESAGFLPAAHYHYREHR